MQGIVGKPAAKPKDESTTIDDLAKNAQNLVRNVSQAIDGQLPDAAQVTQTLSETSQQLATKVKEVVDNLNKQVGFFGFIKTKTDLKFLSNLGSGAQRRRRTGHRSNQDQSDQYRPKIAGIDRTRGREQSQRIENQLGRWFEQSHRSGSKLGKGR